MLRDLQPVAIVPTADAERSKAFYGDVLGLSFVDDDGFALVFQDELEIWTAPGGARVAWFKDQDGNTLSVSQPPG